VCYALVALTNLPVAIAIWVELIWIEHLPGVNALLVVAVVLMAASWFGSLRWRREAVLDLVWSPIPDRGGGGLPDLDHGLAGVGSRAWPPTLWILLALGPALLSVAARPRQSGQALAVRT
jgi:hypothetical protein